MSKITDALGKLDPANDNHWTADGLPRIDTVRMLAADQNISREEITNEAPAFTRQAVLAMAAAPAVTVAPVVVPAAAVAQIAPVVTQATTTESETVKDTEEVILAVVDYDAQIAIAQDELQQAIIERDLAHSIVLQKQTALDEYISAKHAYDPSDSNASIIQSYLKSQGEALVERGRRAAVLRESGVTIADIKNLIPQASPLDQAIASRRK